MRDGVSDDLLVEKDSIGQSLMLVYPDGDYIPMGIERRFKVIGNTYENGQGRIVDAIDAMEDEEEEAAK